MNLKEDIRRQMKLRLAGMDPQALAAESSRLCQTMDKTSRLLNCRFLGIFYPLPDEPDLRPLYQSLPCPMAIPCLEEGRWSFRRVLDLNSTQPAPFGLRTPLLGEIVDPSALDIVLVPGRAFTPSGIRLGRGAGIYDRLLSDAPAWRIGVAFSCQIIPQLPAEPHDLPMHQINVNPVMG